MEGCVGFQSVDAGKCGRGERSSVTGQSSAEATEAVEEEHHSLDVTKSGGAKTRTKRKKWSQKKGSNGANRISGVAAKVTGANRISEANKISVGRKRRRAWG